MVETLSEEAKKLKVGIYEHYKGNIYEVMGVGNHTETEEELVFYRSFQDRYAFWARPLKMFSSTITINGETKPRFQYLGQAGSIERAEAL